MLYYNIMGPPSYMRSVVDRNVVMRPILTYIYIYIYIFESVKSNIHHSRYL